MNVDHKLTGIAERPMEFWENKFTKISHMILTDEKLVDEPFMLTSVDEELGLVTCRCFYASVMFTKDYILTFYNDAGGMCPAELEYLHKAFKQIDGFDFEKEFDVIVKEAKIELTKQAT